MELNVNKEESIINYKDKIEATDEILKKDLFTNPLRELQIKHRMELLEYKEIFENDMLNFENELNHLVLK